MGLVRDTVVPLRLGMVNAFLLKGEGNVLVDAGPPGSEGALLEACREAGVPPDGIGLVVITHAHSDHFGGAAAVQRKSGARVAMHALDAPLAARGHEAPLGEGLAGRLFEALGRFRRTPPGPEADILVEGGLDLSDHGVRGRLLHTPGHTAGSLSVLLEGGDAIVGDLVMGFPPFVRRPRAPLVAQDLVTLRSSLRAVLDPPRPRRILAGHGGPFAPKAVSARLGLG